MRGITNQRNSFIYTPNHNKFNDKTYSDFANNRPKNNLSFKGGAGLEFWSGWWQTFSSVLAVDILLIAAAYSAKNKLSLNSELKNVIWLFKDKEKGFCKEMSGEIQAVISCMDNCLTSRANLKPSDRKKILSIQKSLTGINEKYFDLTPEAPIKEKISKRLFNPGIKEINAQGTLPTKFHLINRLNDIETKWKEYWKGQNIDAKGQILIYQPVVLKLEKAINNLSLIHSGNFSTATDIPIEEALRT